MSQPESAPDHRGDPRFTTTHWSLVVAATEESAPEWRESLEELCKAYWYPLYYYIRRHGHGREDAEDLLQGFLLRMLEKSYLRTAKEERGRFRTFLLTSLKRYMANEWRKASTEKRGGGGKPLRLDLETAERLYQLEMPGHLSPDRIFAERWAMTVLDRTFARLETSYVQAGKQSLFQHLRCRIIGETDTPSYGAVARKLGMTEGAVAMAAHRMRKRFADHLRWEVSQTVENTEEVDDEMRNVCAAFHS